MEFDEELNEHSPLDACSYQLLVSPKQPTPRTFTARMFQRQRVWLDRK
jgi:hypothetical protein